MNKTAKFKIGDRVKILPLATTTSTYHNLLGAITRLGMNYKGETIYEVTYDSPPFKEFLSHFIWSDTDIELSLPKAYKII